jgi:protein-S-isoprenylcysteine O-methyltransferase Ste14
VDRGPYRWVRHPFYFSAILMYLGLALLFPVWMNGICLVIIIAAYTQKTRDEEQYLHENLSGYQEYSKEVIYRFIPRIW